MSIQKLKLRISLFYMKHLLLDFELFTDKHIYAMVQQKLSGPPEPAHLNQCQFTEVGGMYHLDIKGYMYTSWG